MEIPKYEYESLGIDTEKKRFSKYYKAGLLRKVDEEYLTDVKKFWLKNYGKEIDPILHLALYNLTGLKSLEIFPGTEMWNDAIPHFNNLNMSIAYSDKNIYDNLITKHSAAKTVLKCVYGNFFDSHNNFLDVSKALEIIKQHEELIIKPSNTDDGKGINKLVIQNSKIIINNKVLSLKELLYMYNMDFIIQEVIKQHQIMSTPHPYSVNTIRMVTLRWNGEIRYLLSFARFGVNKDVRDNAGAGGVCLGISKNGSFNDIAIDANCFTYTKHPTTNYPFSQMDKIPNFEEFINFAKRLHQNILHHNFVSWDFAVNESGLPVFIEANYKGAVWLYQLAASQPIFGEWTLDIMKEIREGKKDLVFVKKKKDKMSDLRKINKGLKSKNRELKSKLKLRDSEINALKITYMKEIKKIKSSTSWKITKPIRIIGNLIKK